MKYIRKNTFLLFAAGLLLLSANGFSQIENPTLSFNRGALWQSVFFGKIGPTWSNWGKKGIGLDWPGFDETWINANIGGAPSHMATGGFWVGAKKSPDSVLAVEDWSIYAGTISSDAGAKYKITKHTQRYKSGDNYWLKSNNKEGEEVIETSWEYNMNYTNTDDREHQLPVRVTRVAHNWSGSKKDENYILYEYTIKNISKEIKAIDPTRKGVDTLYDFYMMLSYALHVNSRSWNVLFPQNTPGARNTWFFWDNTRKMVWGRSVDYPLTIANEEFGWVASQGPAGEWLAPGFVGVRLLYSSPDNSKQATKVNQYGWSAGLSSIDQSGPFNGVPGTNEAKYGVLKDIRTASNFVSSPADTTYMKKSRMWSLMSLGPWTILPGDSIVIAVAEIVNGIDYKDALNKNMTSSVINSRGQSLFNQSADRAKLTYDQYRNSTSGLLTGKGLNHPDPPAAPKFTVDYYKGERKLAANVLSWGTESESAPDPDDGSFDLHHYVVYRSVYLPIGPWDTVAVITKGDPQFYSTSDKKYTFIDSSAVTGSSYYYSITASDNGKPNWAVDLTAVFPDTKSNVVSPMESSISSNRMTRPFTKTFAAAQTLNDVIVAPNPFRFRDYNENPSENEIQFVFLPNPCTIRIYTVRGDLVKTLKVGENEGGIKIWDRTTDFGQYVRSGIYIYHIDSPKGTKIGKLAIVN